MIRGKQPEANLRLTYRKTLWACTGLSTLVHAALFGLFPNFEPEAYAKPEQPIIIQLEEIPETKQERRPPSASPTSSARAYRQPGCSG